MRLVNPHLVFDGDRFGHLVVLRYTHQDKRWRRHYEVVCDCGRTKTVQGTLLRTGNTKSCGPGCKARTNASLLPNDRAPINQIILQYKRHARDRNIVFDLSYEEVEQLVRSACFYCGEPAGNTKRTKNRPDGFRHNGIDRVDSDKHYHSGNVVPCCGVCNRAKRDMNGKKFLEWVARIANHQWGASVQLEMCA